MSGFKLSYLSDIAIAKYNSGTTPSPEQPDNSKIIILVFTLIVVGGFFILKNK